MGDLRVLIVDDDEDILLITSLALERVAGWTVYTCNVPEDALLRAEQLQPDVMLLDVMMPGLDGPALFARLDAAIPVIFVTAHSQPHQVERLRRLGACGVIHKPFDPMGLHLQVADLLGLAQ